MVGGVHVRLCVRWEISQLQKVCRDLVGRMERSIEKLGDRSPSISAGCFDLRRLGPTHRKVDPCPQASNLTMMIQLYCDWEAEKGISDGVEEADSYPSGRKWAIGPEMGDDPIAA